MFDKLSSVTDMSGHIVNHVTLISKGHWPPLISKRMLLQEIINKDFFFFYHNINLLFIVLSAGKVVLFWTDFGTKKNNFLKITVIVDKATNRNSNSFMLYLFLYLLCIRPVSAYMESGLSPQALWQHCCGTILILQSSPGEVSPLRADIPGYALKHHA